MVTSEHNRLKWAESRVKFTRPDVRIFRFATATGFLLALGLVCLSFPFYQWFEATRPIVQAVGWMVFFLVLGVLLLRR